MTELQRLRHANAIIDEELQSRNREAPRDRVSELRKLIEEKQKRLAETAKFVNDARSYVKTFPTEGMLLKLERRVESVKDQIKQAERIASQHKAGIEAYYARLESNRSDLEHTLESATGILENVSTIVDPLVREELSIVGTHAASCGCDALSSIMLEREAELHDKCSALTEVVREESDLLLSTGTLHQALEEAIPMVEDEKDTDEDEIRTAWSQEELTLKTILNRLYTVHKEQAFHLQRGTHIKKDTSGPKTSIESEIVLSTRQSHLASELNKGRAVLQELKEELLLARKQIESLRSKARECQSEFECEHDARNSRLSAAKRRHQMAMDESALLRDTKAQLYEKLQEMREVPQHTPRVL